MIGRTDHLILQRHPILNVAGRHRVAAYSLIS